MSSGPSSSLRPFERLVDVRFRIVTRFASVVSAPQHRHVASSMPSSAAHALQNPTIRLTFGSPVGRDDAAMRDPFAACPLTPRTSAHRAVR